MLKQNINMTVICNDLFILLRNFANENLFKTLWIYKFLTFFRLWYCWQPVLKSKNTKTETCILGKMSGRPFQLSARGRKTKQRKGLIRVNGEGNVKRNRASSQCRGGRAWWYQEWEVTTPSSFHISSWKEEEMGKGWDEICWLASCCVRRPEFDGTQQGWESTLLTAFEG